MREKNKPIKEELKMMSEEELKKVSGGVIDPGSDSGDSTITWSDLSDEQKKHIKKNYKSNYATKAEWKSAKDGLAQLVYGY